MTWILSMHDYKQRQLPTVGYLKASSGRQDSDCLNRPHLANVMQARRDRENYAHPSGEDTPGPLTPRAGHDAPDLPAASLIERITDWYDAAPHFGPVAVACVVITIFLAALIVTGIAGDLVRWMAS